MCAPMSPSLKLTLSKTVSIIFLFCFATAISSPAQIFTTLVNFNRSDGANPHASLIQGIDGNLYGTTVSGGSGVGFCAGDNDGCGTVFKITPTGTLTTIYSFCSPQGDCSNGANPVAGLVQASDGNFYGTTAAGGDYNGGTIFKITPAGVLTRLYSFDGTHGNDPEAGLVQASDGNFYGTTAWGGAYGSGTVFKITPGGVLTILYSFGGYPDGRLPVAGLLQAADGNLYGTTARGGSNIIDAGTVFRITLGGTLTTLHTFDGNDGGDPGAALVQAADGNLYGTTSWDGDNGGYGTVFKMTLGGTMTTLHSFSGYPIDGGDPYAGLVQATDGNFYGTTWWGGSHNYGTVFEITPAGTLTTLYNFCSQPNCMDGDSPYAALVQATNGILYGTTTQATNCFPYCGTVFSLSMGLSPFVETQPTSGQVGAPVTILGTNLTGSTSVTFNGTAAAFNVVSASEITTTVPAGATTGTVQVMAPGGTLTSNADFQIIGPLQLIPLTPCRLVDTRQTGGPIQGGTSRNFTVPQLGSCGIPTSAAAYSLNVTVAPHGPLGYLTIWPNGEVQPYVSAMNSLDGRVKANAAIVPAGNNAVSVFASNTTDVILDIDGYFAPPGSETYQFYPLPPCRVADTRKSNGDLGGPFLNANQERDFPVLESSCIPQGIAPQAYSLNFTAVPHPSGQGLGYLTIWPTGEPKPGVSTLNNLTGTIVANAGIVPAGTRGDIAVYPNGTTDLVIDINGYFAVPGQGGLSLYPVTPCRVIDTRKIGNGEPFSGTLNPPVDVVDSVCAPSSNAQAYVFNATVVPTGDLGFLTLWPDSENQPGVSTLNAIDGAITSNMAIVPNINGKTDAFASGITQLILDISSYFAP